MKTLSLRLPDDVHTAVSAAAAEDHRSLNSEIIVLLLEALAARSSDTN